MILHSLENREKKGYTTWGCMWERGRCGKNTTYILNNQDKSIVPMQTRITAYWPDGSVKWTAHSADSKALSQEIQVLPVVEGAGNPRDVEEGAGIQRDVEEGAGIRRDKGEREREADNKATNNNKIKVHKNGSVINIHAGKVDLELGKNPQNLFDCLWHNGKPVLKNARSVLILQEPIVTGGNRGRIDREYTPVVETWSLEEEGDLMVVIKCQGAHIPVFGNLQKTETRIPFLIRLKIGLDSSMVDVTHTFLYDGNEETEDLKGLGVTFDVPVWGPLYNRHVKFEGDYGCFHESLAELLSWRPRVPEPIYQNQMAGRQLFLNEEEKTIVEQVMEAMPFWSEYDLCQDSASHFSIRKKVFDDNCCYLDCLTGCRTKGAAAFGSEAGSFMVAIRDFWEKYPSGYTFQNLDQDEANATVWLWSPKAEPMDFRHYANRGYNQVYYEGYDHKGATPYGIACTNEFSLTFEENMIPGDERLLSFSKAVNRPAQYVGTPEFYHERKAFGHWSLPGRQTQMEVWLENQLDLAVEFYKTEVKQRSWYGMFNYGDFMHTYDRERHQWRYDMGGYAWDNTELVPTLWLWLMFMRTGREDVFTLAEKLSRHASEVDVYHMGSYKGLGSRHNVRHWGCPCKEARIAMAAHHRFFYYMTGDHRMEDIFEELKDNEMTFLNKDPLEAFYEKDTMVYPTHARSGPDWSSLCANWLTQWERFQDNTYRNKIQVGISDIKQAPLQLVSGPDFEFDPMTTHLRYIGERAAGGTHLQICMGAPQVWLELADLLGDEEWTRMLADYGRFYYLSEEQQQKQSKGIIGNREFSLPFMAAAMGAFGAWYFGDQSLAKTTWMILLNAMIKDGNCEGFQANILEHVGNQEALMEIPWISTNFVAQWCLNVIMVLEFIPEYLPKTLEDACRLVGEAPKDGFRKA